MGPGLWSKAPFVRSQVAAVCLNLYALLLPFQGWLKEQCQPVLEAPFRALAWLVKRRVLKA